MKQAFGVLALLLGGVMLVTLVYGLLADQGKGGAQIEPFRAVAFIVVLFTFGVLWLRGKSPGTAETSRPAPRPEETPPPGAGLGQQPAKDITEVVLARSVQKTSAPSRSKLDELRSFDLAKLNWVGWLLLIGSFAVAIAGTIVAGLYADQNKDRLGDRAFVLIAVPILGLSIGFFFGCRWLLKRVGVSVYRPERNAGPPGRDQL